MRLLTLVALVGCGGKDSASDDTGGFAYGAFGSYDPDFTPLTWSYTPGGEAQSSDNLQVSVTDRDGLTDCGLSADWDARPAYPASQIFVAFRDSNFQDCPDQLFTVGECGHDNQDELGSECARYRQWDANGDPVADLKASSGALRVTPAGSRCTLELEVSFPGGTFTGTASFDVDASSSPYCEQ